MPAHEVEKEIIQLKKDIASLKREFVKDIASLQLQSKETFDKAGEAKHAAKNALDDITAFIRIHKEIQASMVLHQTTMMKNQEAIQELIVAKKVGDETKKADSEKVNRILAFVDMMSALATPEGWKALFSEGRENTKYRESKNSVGSFFLRVGAVCAAILAAIALAKVIGLYK